MSDLGGSVGTVKGSMEMRVEPSIGAGVGEYDSCITGAPELEAVRSRRFGLGKGLDLDIRLRGRMKTGACLCMTGSLELRGQS